MANYAGVDIFVEGAALRDFLKDVKGGEIRVSDVPIANSFDLNTTYADQNGITRGQRAMYTTKGSASKVVNISIYGNIDCINKITEKINYFFVYDESKKIIFGNDPNYYQMGRVSSSFAPEISAEEAVPKASGSVSFIFDDPLKIAVAESQLTIGKKTDAGEITKLANGRYQATIENQDGEETELKIEISSTAENGYVGIASSDDTFQVGDVNNSNKELETIIDIDTPEEIKEALKNGVKNKGINVVASENNFTANVISVDWNGESNLALDGKGLSSLTIDLGDDPKSKSEYFWWRQIFWAGGATQQGAIKVLFSDQNGKLLYGAETIKRYKAFSAEYNSIIGRPDGSYMVMRTHKFIPSHLHEHNPFNAPAGWSDIHREKNKLSFYWYGGQDTFNVPELEGRRATKLHVVFQNIGTEDFITRAYFSRLKFFRTESESLSDVTNPFGKNTNIVLESQGNKVNINGIYSLQSVVKGSRVPKLKKGKNIIDIELSKWIKSDPDIKLSYRKRKI